MGSVKDLKILRGAKTNSSGLGIFDFSNRYSVFDWGEMPDHIPNKGEALALIGAYFFEKTKELGIKTHYRGLIEFGRVTPLADLENPTNKMEVDLVKVIRPGFNNGKYDYSMYNSELKNFLIPLEVIYRNRLPEGSSVFKRLETKQTTPGDLGLDHYPQPGEELEHPIFDLSTKLEKEDRHITWKQAQEIAKLTGKEIRDIKETLSKVNYLITRVAKKNNLVNCDGKIELAYDKNRNLMLVDVIGTLDESRFTFNRISFSKEVARQFYKKTNWYNDVLEAKKLAEEKGVQDWKSLCKSTPKRLDSELRTIISEMYMSAANAFTQREFFPCPNIEEVIGKYSSWIKNN